MAYNIFKRPSFRKGGIANLEPRQGYADKGSVQKIEDLMAQRRQAYETAAQPTGGELALLLASAIGKKPGGNIGEIAGEVSTQLQPLFTKKKEIKAKLAGQDIEDLISLEKLKAYRDRYTQTATGGVTGYKLGEFRKLKSLVQKQGKFKAGQKLEMGILAGQRIPSDYEIRQDYVKAVQSDPVFSSLSPAEREKQIQDYVKRTNDSILQGLIDQTITEGEVSKQDSSTNDTLTSEIESLGKADGGRIGYAEGSMVQNQTRTTQASMTTDQGKSKDARYQELRDRLPAEITDDVVQLIAYNNSAFQDFASIQSQADIDNFNQRYGVTLAVPMNT
jgi:hypothetical protein